MRLADSPEAFAQAVASLLTDPDQRAALGEQAYQHVRAHYDWSVIIPKVEAVYTS